MAGLIEQQMQQGEAPPEAMPPPDAQQVATPEGDQGPDPEASPEFADALRFAMTALYENGGAKGVAQALASADDKIGAVADTAYKITSIVDERTQGNLPEELLIVLGMSVLEEVADICEAAGYGCKPAEIAEAFKRMVLRFVEEQGYDITELQAAMDSIDPEQIAAAAESQPAPAPAPEDDEEIPA